MASRVVKNKIPKDATITVIRGRLSDPDAYLRGVLGNMILCRKRYGTAVVRIGTSGEGRAPHYRVQPAETYVDATMREVFAVGDPEALAREEERTNTSLYTAYHGKSHEPLKWGKKELQDVSWSDRWMNIEQVQSLLGEVRGIKPKATDA